MIITEMQALSAAMSLSIMLNNGVSERVALFRVVRLLDSEKVPDDQIEAFLDSLNWCHPSETFAENLNHIYDNHE